MIDMMKCSSISCHNTATYIVIYTNTSHISPKCHDCIHTYSMLLYHGRYKVLTLDEYEICQVMNT